MCLYIYIYLLESECVLYIAFPLLPPKDIFDFSENIPPDLIFIVGFVHADITCSMIHLMCFSATGACTKNCGNMVFLSFICTD